MHAQKPIVDLNFRYDTESILNCLWAIKNGSKEQFMIYGQGWINKVVKQKVHEGVQQMLKNNSTFKKSEVFKEAYIKYNGDMKKIMKAMDISDRTYFRHKKDFIDEATKKDVQKKKYASKPSRHLPPQAEGVPPKGGREVKGVQPHLIDIEIISLYKPK